MPTGAITNYIDVAQLTLWAFWFFFFGLVFYIRREDKREGYPVISQRMRGVKLMQGFPPMPKPKTFKMMHTGRLVVKPGPEKAEPEPNAVASAPFPGAPLVPNGNPMLAGVGPGSYNAGRVDEPDRTIHGKPRMQPLRAAKQFSIVGKDPDPRGLPVVGCDGAQGGVVKDVWVDCVEPQVRYLELEVKGGKRALLPINMCVVKGKKGLVEVVAITGAQFADVPGLKNPDQITLAEEDRVTAYYGAGTLYATAERAEPFL